MSATESNNTKTITIVEGGKGGVGKSHFALMTADRLRAAGCRVAGIDQDTTNPDFARLTQDYLPSAITPAGDLEAWSNLLIAAEQMLTGADYLIVNTAAGSSGVERPEVRELLGQWLRDNRVDLITMFIVSKSADSPNLAARSLAEGFASMASRRIAILNGYFGELGGRAFDRWRQSESRRQWIDAGGLEAYAPDLFWQVVDAILANGVLPQDLIPHLNSVHCIQLVSWLNKFSEGVLAPLGLPTATAYTAPPEAQAEDQDEEAAA